MPPQAVAAIELRYYNLDGEAVLTSTRQPLEGRQVPLPFHIKADIPASDAQGLLELRAAIELDGRLIRLSDPIPVFHRSGEHDIGELKLQPFNALAFGTAWMCGDIEVMLGAMGNNPLMRVGVKQFVMQQTRSASGVRHEAQGDPSTVLHSKGREALVSLRGDLLPDCRMIEQPELPLTARGNEPPWQVQVANDQLKLSTNYGTRHESFALLATRQSGPETRYLAASNNQSLTLTITPGVCRDSMSGMPHPYAAELATAQGTLPGCAGRPVALLSSHEWSITLLDGQPPAVDSTITLTFSAEDSRVFGNASCNRFNAGFTLDGENLRFSHAASTMMACPEPLMHQERSFFRILEGIQAFDIDGNGVLELIGTNGRLHARR